MMTKKMKMTKKRIKPLRAYIMHYSAVNVQFLNTILVLFFSLFFFYLNNENYISYHKKIIPNQHLKKKNPLGNNTIDISI